MAKLRILLYFYITFHLYMYYIISTSTDSVPLQIYLQRYLHIKTTTSVLLELLHLVVLKAVLYTVLPPFPPLHVAMITSGAAAYLLPWQQEPVHHNFRFSFIHLWCQEEAELLSPPPAAQHAGSPLPTSLHVAPPSVIPPSVRSLISFISTRFTLCPPPPPPPSSHRERDMNPDELWVINPALCRFLVIISVNWTLIIISLQRRQVGGGGNFFWVKL